MAPPMIKGEIGKKIQKNKSKLKISFFALLSILELLEFNECMKYEYLHLLEEKQ